MQEAVDELLAQQLQDEGEDGGFDMLVQNPRAPRVPRPVVAIEPEPPVTLEQWEATKELRCRYCPHPTDTHPRPPQVPLEGAPWTHFRCGCRVHTICYAITLVSQEYAYTTFCPVCNTRILTDEQRQFLSQARREAQRDDPIDKRMDKLWKEDEAFRETMKEVAAEGRKLGPLHTQYKKDINAIRQEWKTAIGPSLNILRNYKQMFTKKLKTIESRKKYFLAYGRYKTKYYRFLRTYDIEPHGMDRRRRRDSGGMPKLRHVHRWGLWRDKAWHIFRVRV